MGVVKNIADGYINLALGRKGGMAEERMKICKMCPLFKDAAGGICNPRLWLNPTTGEVKTEKAPGFYRGCGCSLLAKTRAPYANCPAKKW